MNNHFELYKQPSTTTETENNGNKSSVFEKKIKPVLQYVGTIGSIIMAIAYIVIICILIFGFKAQSFIQTFVFSLVSAAVGIIIMQLLKVQGEAFAKAIPYNQHVLNEYYNTKTKDKKPHSMKFFWITSVIKDIIVKGITVMISTAGIIYIVVQGSEDFTLLLLALANLLMFACFGILSLVKSYDFFNEEHIPYIINQLELVKKESKEKQDEEDKRIMEMVKNSFDKQRDDLVHTSGRADILESSDSNQSISNNSESMVLDSNINNNSVLGRAIHTSCTTPNSTNSSIEETTLEDLIKKVIKQVTDTQIHTNTDNEKGEM